MYLRCKQRLSQYVFKNFIKTPLSPFQITLDLGQSFSMDVTLFNLFKISYYFTNVFAELVFKRSQQVPMQCSDILTILLYLIPIRTMKKMIDKSKNNFVCTLYIRQIIDIEQGSQEAVVTNKPDKELFCIYCTRLIS